MLPADGGGVKLDSWDAAGRSTGLVWSFGSEIVTGVSRDGGRDAIVNNVVSL